MGDELRELAGQYGTILEDGGYSFVRSEVGGSFDHEFALYQKENIFCMVIVDRGSVSMAWHMGHDRSCYRSLDLWKVASELDGSGKTNPLDEVCSAEYAEQNLGRIEEFVRSYVWD